MKKYFFLLIFFSCNIVFSQSLDELKALALKDAKTTAKATLEMDFETVLKYTHPDIIKNSGGKDVLMQNIKATFDELNEQGFVFEKAEVLEVSNLIKEDGEYHCLVKNNNQMKLPGTRIKSISYLFGFYDDLKKQWYFLEARQLKNKALVDQFLPGFKTSINLPDDETTTESIKNK